MKKLISLILILTLIFTACAQEPKTDDVSKDQTGDSTGTQQPSEPVETSLFADEQTYSTVYSDEITTLNYLISTTTVEFALFANFIDTLVDYDRYGVIQPALAAEWTKSEDGLVWTFKIREGVKWVTADGEVYADVTANDFVESAKYILNSDNISESANILYSVIKNAEAFYNKEITDFNQVGVKAIDEYTLEYTLINPVPYFESMLTYVCFFPVNGQFLAEMGEDFGTDAYTVLYNGGYVLSSYEPQNSRVLTKNENYWDKENIFIEKISQKYNKEASAIAVELFQRGEISYVEIPTAQVDQWLKDPALFEQIRPGRKSFYTYFYALNFDPQFEAQYEPDNWRKAVNSTNFRNTLFHGLDRVAALLCTEPYDPEYRLLNTITPENFIALDGVDYTSSDFLKQFTDTESFDSAKALEYKEKALTDLNAAGVTLPIKIPMPYNTGGSSNAMKAQVIEQQLEKLLGKDFIDIIPLPYPPSGYLDATRRCGNYAIQECNWGPDYADPYTYAEPFLRGKNYNFPEFITELDENGKNIYEVYEAMVNEANNEMVDLNARYEMFAKAEAYLIDKAFIIPYSVGGGGYVASKINPFESQYSAFGVSSDRYKGQKVYKKSMSTEEFYAAQEEWNKKREEALKGQ